MKRISFFLIILSWSFAIYSQEIKVVDAYSKKGIPFAVVYNPERSLSTLTDERGFFDLGVFKTNDSLVFRSLGYSTTIESYSNVGKMGTVLLKRKAFNLNAVQVSALRWRLNPNDIPNKIYSVDKEDLFIQQPQSAADLLSVSNKVFIQKSQMGGGSPMIRGFASNRLLYTIDGIRMNTAIFRGGNVHNVISLDPFTIEESEIMLGPGSVMYGSDALGGVLRFETLKPEFSNDSSNRLSGNLGTRFSSANSEKTVHLDVNVGHKKWAFLSSITLTDFNHLNMGKNGPEEYLQDTFAIRFQNRDALATPKNNRIQMNTAYSQRNFMQKIAHQLDSNQRLEYAFHYSETSDIPRYDRLRQKRNGTLRFGEWEYGPQKWVMHHLSWKRDKKSALSDLLNIDLAYQHFEESRKNRLLYDELLNINEETVAALSLNVDFIKSLNTKHKLTYGAEAIWNKINSVGNILNINTNSTSLAASRYPNSNWFSNALYFNDIYSINGNTTLNVGARLNHFALGAKFDTALFSYPETNTSLSFLAFTGSIGLSHQINDYSLITFLVSNGFRAPNIDDIGKIFDSEPGAIVVPNTELKSEKVYNFEFGIKHSIKAKLLLDVSAYYSLLNDAMARRNSSFQGQDSIVYQGVLSQVQSIQNGSTAFIYGFNFGAQYTISRRLKLNGNYNYQKGEESVGGIKSPIRHVSPSFGNLEMNYSTKKITVSIDVQFSQGFDFEDLNIGEQNKPHLYAINSLGNPHSPSWYSVNVGAAYASSKSMRWFVGIDNLSNQRYRAYSSGISSAGRNFIVSANYKF